MTPRLCHEADPPFGSIGSGRFPGIVGRNQKSVVAIHKREREREGGIVSP